MRAVRAAADRALVEELRAIVGPGAVLTEPAALARAGRDRWPRGLLLPLHGSVAKLPEVVCRPASAEQVAAVLRLAARRGVPVVPHGARSGVCGGTVHLRGGIALDLGRLSAVRRIDPERLEIEVEAGAIGWSVEERLVALGLTLGHAPSSIALSSVGGWIAARGAGQGSSRYGKIEDLLLGVEAVLADGSSVRLERPVAGSDLLEILLGSEGALAVVVAARLRLFPRPAAQLPAGYRFDSLEEGLAALEAIFAAGLRPGVARLYDPFDTWLALGGPREEPLPTPPPGPEDLLLAWERGERVGRGAKGRALGLALAAPAVANRVLSLLRRSLLVLVHEGSGAEARSELHEARAIALRHGGRDLGPGPGRRWLARRWEISRTMPRIFDAGGWVDTCEVATSWSRLGELHRRVREAVAPHALTMAHFSHAWPDGCSIYFTFAGSALPPEEGLRRYDAAWRAALDSAAEAGATITHHHGVGLLKAPWLAEELGAGGMALLGACKRAWDPAGLLNPGKLGLGAGPEGARGLHEPSREGGASEAPWSPAEKGGETVSDATNARIAPKASGSTDRGRRCDSVANETTGRGGRKHRGDRSAGGRIDGASAETPGHPTRPSLLAGLDADGIGPLDPRSGWIACGAGVPVGRLERRLRVQGFTTGFHPPSVLAGTVGAWLEGSYAGRRAVEGRLEPAVAAVEATLSGGLRLSTVPAPRSAAGPAVAHLILGGGGAIGRLDAAILKARPMPRATRRVALAGEAAALLGQLVAALRTFYPPLEACWIDGSRIELLFSVGRADERAALEAFCARAEAAGLAPAIGGCAALGRMERFEGACEIEVDPASLKPVPGHLHLTRMARESVVVVADRPLPLPAPSRHDELFERIARASTSGQARSTGE